MAERNPTEENPSDHISDSETSEEEVDAHLCTSEEEQHYNTIRSSAQATQAAHSVM